MSIHMNKGDVVFEIGSQEDAMYLVVFGEVGIYADDAAQKLLTTCSEGNFFGEMGMIEGKPRSAKAVALKNVTLEKITKENFGEFFRTKPAKAHMILQNTSHRMRELSADYEEACKVIAAYVAAKDKGDTPSEELMARMKKIIGVGKRS